MAVNTPPAAPRAAYLLTAAMADNTQRVGAIVAGDDMSNEWGGYDESVQRDILAALGEQTRVALTMLRARLGAEIEMDWDSTARVVCSEALAAARELVRPEPGSGRCRNARTAGRSSPRRCAACRSRPISASDSLS